MTSPPRVRTKVKRRLVREDDLSDACARFCISKNQFLSALRDVELEREWQSLSTRIRSVFAQMDAAKARGAPIFEFLECIEKLEKKRTANMDARFGRVKP